MKYPEKYERDELRGRFTRFMEVMVKRARLNYLAKLRRQPDTLPIDELPEELFAVDAAFQLQAQTILILQRSVSQRPSAAFPSCGSAS